jgi:hypothetical protein
MSDAGWIKLHRKLLKNPVVMKDGDHLAVWVYLLLKASRVVHDSIFDGKTVQLKPGQLIIGRRVISADTRIHESKVQRILKCFESEHLFKQQTCSKSRLISILKWKEYQISEQVSEQQMNNNRTTSEQQPNTIQEVLELKEVKEERISAREKFFENRKLVEGILMNWRITPDQLNKMLDAFDLMILAEGKESIPDAEYRNYFQKWGAKRFTEYSSNHAATKTTMVY